MTDASTTADLVGFHHVALTVRDLERSLSWYRDVLGFRLRFREEGPERRAAVLEFADGSFGVGLVEHRAASDGPFDPTRLGLDHLAFTVADRASLGTWTDRLDAAGVVHSGVIDIPTGAICNFADPDGIRLALFCDAPGA